MKNRIFVTVGTHEQPFNRLIEAVDNLVKLKKISSNVFIQIGYSTYVPKYCKWERFLSYDEMKNMINDAEIVITHGGPSSFILPLQVNKIPIVVPRQKKYHEHVNNHQVNFASEVAKINNNLIVVNDICELGYVINHYNLEIQKLSNTNVNNNKVFNDRFYKLVKKLLKK